MKSSRLLIYCVIIYTYYDTIREGVILRIKGSFAEILLVWMKQFGYADQEFKTRVQLLAENDWLTVEEWRELLTTSVQMSVNPNIGIAIGSSVLVQHAGVLGYLMLNSHTLAEALDTYILCEKHFYDVNFVEINRTETEWRLSWPDLTGNDNAVFVQVSLSALVTFLRQRFPGSCDLKQITFSGNKPENEEVYKDFFHCDVIFNSTHPGITFDSQSIHKQVHGLLPSDYQRMRNHQLQAFDQVIKINDPFLQRFQHVILSLMPEGKARLPIIANRMNCSTRTLQRKLERYNLSYQLLIDCVRENLAYKYLQGTSLSLAEISLLLGFSDQSAFTRAFKVWTDTTPAKARGV